jgi:O-antigen/teichoic acid export membrane protein
MTETVNNKRIAKNATMLMLRMIVTTIIGLYTSRVIINALGEENYGIYGVVGGITSMFAFLNTSMAGATSRFLTFEIGKDDKERLKRTFSSAVFVHIIISVIVVLLAETIGVWLLNTKLNIPDGRMGAANWVLQCSIIATGIGIMQVPYNALVIAYERMTVFAYIEVLSAVLKLAIALALMLTDDLDKLKLYSVLLLATTFITTAIYRGYCLYHFKESRTRIRYDAEILKPMLKFSGYDLYGNMSLVVSNQGRNMLINIFFGVIYNAAVSIALTVQGILLGLTGSITQAFRPQIIKQYASGQIETMQLLMERASVFVVVALTMLCIPCMLQANYVLTLWLGQVPYYTEIFLQLLLINSVMSAYNTICNAAIHATGNIKYISFISGSLILFNLFLTWVAFKLGAGAWVAYFLCIVISVVIIGLAYWIIHRLIPNFRIRRYLLRAVRLFTVSAVSYALVRLLTASLTPSFITLIVVCIASCIVTGLLSWIFLFDDNMKQMVKGIVAKYLPHKKLNAQ